MSKGKKKPARPIPTRPPVVVAPCPTCLILRITEIRGLYQPGKDDRPAPPDPGTTQGSGYVGGYTSSDGQGRIFINSKPLPLEDPLPVPPATPVVPVLSTAVWTKNTQYVEITVVVDPPSIAIPAGSKITWSFTDPDDPTNEGPWVQVDAGKLLDPGDYDAAKPPTKTSATDVDNDPYRKRQESASFEQISAKYALSGDDTLIDIPNRTSRVRFKVSDIGGDNWVVKADMRPVAPILTVKPTSTGIMTAWNRIEVEYVKMASADELPVDQIALHYDMACVQVDVSMKREVSGSSDKAFFGKNDAAADTAIADYATKKKGVFTQEGRKGWFFIAAANRMLPQATATFLFQGNATAKGKTVTLPSGTVLAGTPAIVRVFDSAMLAGLPAQWPDDPARYVTFQVTAASGNKVRIIPHDFHEVDDPDNSFLDADLTTYGFPSGSSIPIQLWSAGEGAVVVRGISPGGKDVPIPGKPGQTHHFFGGRLVVFTKSIPGPGGGPGATIRLVCHELCHAFDNAHKCGNWDWIEQPNRTSCCMNYWIQFLLDDASPRAPLRWTQNRMSPELCAAHVRHIRDYHLEDNPGLGWGKP